MSSMRSWLGPLLQRWSRHWHPRRASLAEWERHHAANVVQEVERVLPHIPDGGAFIDVGANLGLFTETILRARPNCRAWLFEPVQELYGLCKARFGNNPQVVVENFALAHENTRTVIWKARHNPGGNSLVHDLMFDRRDVAEVTPKTVHDEEEIECRVFDQYAAQQGIGRVDFIKTDTEGFDYRVLEGMLGFIAGCHPRPVILSELMEEAYHPHWDEQLRIVERLYALGYRRVDLASMKKIDDILFVPEDRDGPS